MSVQKHRVFVAGAGITAFNQPGPSRLFCTNCVFVLPDSSFFYFSIRRFFHSQVFAVQDMLHLAPGPQRKLFAALASNCAIWTLSFAGAPNSMMISKPSDV
jgi:hypothetical protein